MPGNKEERQRLLGDRSDEYGSVNTEGRYTSIYGVGCSV